MRLILEFLFILSIASSFGATLVNELKSKNVSDNQKISENEFSSRFVTEVGEQSVKFYVYNRENLETPDFVESNVESIIRTIYNPLKPTVFSIHGWLSNKDSDENKIIVPAKLEQEDCNVIVVDYSLVLSEQSTEDIASYVGAKVADFILLLYTYFDVKISNIHVVGFSMGAQTSGFVGQFVYKSTGEKIAKITGLDPAGGMYNSLPEDERLSADDAHFVEVIHTNGGIVGYYAPCGHADYYPNGGRIQPGCSVIDLGCSHLRAFELVAEMWSAKNEYVVLKCASTSQMSLDQCSWVNVNMGKNSERPGIYYLQTNNATPFGKGSYVRTFL
ncbi:phospholipase A1-like [Teleopsis dalmanni]|uniref:phospholipase A1-like n=1 Tax=Teleopsis dalmanni TaxID=139649 RepID=UPI0018CF00FC|nr:phospholipase A1-like [Teleopsis dalmanni]